MLDREGFRLHFLRFHGMGHGIGFGTVRDGAGQMKLTIREAAQSVGVGKSTIHRMVKDGRLSATKGEDGVFKIDPAELGLVFGRVPWDGSRDGVGDDAGQDRDGASHGVLAERLVAAERALAREREISADLARRLDEEAQERRRLTALLTHQREPAPSQEAPQASQAPGRLTLVEKLFGRRGGG